MLENTINEVSIADIQIIVDAITASAGSHGYSAQVGTGSNAGKVELTPPTTVDGAIADETAAASLDGVSLSASSSMPTIGAAQAVDAVAL